MKYQALRPQFFSVGGWGWVGVGWWWGGGGWWWWVQTGGGMVGGVIRLSF